MAALLLATAERPRLQRAEAERANRHFEDRATVPAAGVEKYGDHDAQRWEIVSYLWAMGRMMEQIGMAMQTLRYFDHTGKRFSPQMRISSVGPEMPASMT